MPNLPDFGLFTVPHSGTRFTMEFFSKIRLKPWNPSRSTEKVTFMQMHSGSTYFGQRLLDEQKLFRKLPTIVTVTHPYRCWVSHNARGKGYDENVDSWQHLIKYMPEHNCYLFDINCRESLREKQIYGMLDFLDLNTPDRKAETDKFIAAWPTVRPKDSEQKRSFLTDGTMPEGYDYSRLQFAVDWYESLPTNDL